MYHVEIADIMQFFWGHELNCIFTTCTTAETIIKQAIFIWSFNKWFIFWIRAFVVDQFFIIVIYLMSIDGHYTFLNEIAWMWFKRELIAVYKFKDIELMDNLAKYCFWLG